jgi:hypothetical protein
MRALLCCAMLSFCGSSEVVPRGCTFLTVISTIVPGMSLPTSDLAKVSVVTAAPSTLRISSPCSSKPLMYAGCNQLCLSALSGERTSKKTRWNRDADYEWKHAGKARQKNMSDLSEDRGRETPPTTMLSTMQFDMIIPTVAFVENPEENDSVWTGCRTLALVARRTWGGKERGDQSPATRSIIGQGVSLDLFGRRMDVADWDRGPAWQVLTCLRACHHATWPVQESRQHTTSLQSFCAQPRILPPVHTCSHQSIAFALSLRTGCCRTGIGTTEMKTLQRKLSNVRNKVEKYNLCQVVK